MSMARGLPNNSGSHSFADLERPLELDPENQQNNQIDIDIGGDSGTLFNYDSGSCLLGQQPSFDVFTIAWIFQKRLHSK
jgi:hypothetical protein